MNNLFNVWLTYYSLPSVMIGILVFTYQIDKVYKKSLTDKNKGYNILKGGIYDKNRTT